MPRYISLIGMTLITLIFFSNGNVFASVNDSDVSITNNVKSRIETYNEEGLDVEVKTTNGICAIAGDVNSTEEAIILIEITQSTPAVKDVDASRLTINESDMLTMDSIITAKIKGVLIRDKVFGEEISSIPCDIETNHGRVFLVGTILQAQLDNVIKSIRPVNGIKIIDSRIKIEAPHKEE